MKQSRKHLKIYFTSFLILFILTASLPIELLAAPSLESTVNPTEFILESESVLEPTTVYEAESETTVFTETSETSESEFDSSTETIAEEDNEPNTEPEPAPLSPSVSDNNITAFSPFSFQAGGVTAYSESPEVLAAVNEMINECIADDMNEMEKALAIHDYFCLHYSYSHASQNGLSSHDYPCMLLYHTGVCQAYADAYSLVMQTLGITCYTVICNPMTHVWNAIQIDGEWYLVDITWDDRYNSSDEAVTGFAGHQYFLCSLDAFADHEPCENPPLGAFTSTKYDNAFFRNLKAPVCITQDYYYYPQKLENGYWGIYALSAADSSDSKIIKEVDCSLPTGGSVCMGLAEQSGRLYYNDASAIYSCLPDGSHVDKIADAPVNQYFSRLYISSDTVYYGLQSSNPYLPTSGSCRIPAKRPVTSISLSETDLTITPGSNGQLTASILPENASSPVLSWFSDAPSIVSVDSKTGAFEAQQAGSAILTAASTDGSNISAFCTITVKNVIPSIDGPRLSQTALTLNKQQTTGAVFSLFPVGEDEIIDISLQDERFSIEKYTEEDSYQILIKDSSVAKGTYKVPLHVTTSNIYEYTLTLTVTDTKPTIRTVIPKINLFYTKKDYPITVFSPQGACTVEGIADSSALSGFTESFTFENGALRLKEAVTAPVKKGVLLVAVKGYSIQQIPVTLSTCNFAPKLVPSVSKAVFHKDSGSHDLSFFVYDKNDKTKTPAALDSVSLARNNKNEEINGHQLTAKLNSSNQITLTLRNDYLESLRRSATINVQLLVTCSDFDKPVLISLTLTLQTTLPTIKYSARTLGLNRNLLGEQAKITLLSSQYNLPVDHILVEPFASNPDTALTLENSISSGNPPTKNTLTARLTQAPRGKSYRFKITPCFSQELVGKSVTITVNITDKTPALSLTAKGAGINVLDRENTPQQYRVKLINCVDEISAITLDSASQDLFDHTLENGILSLSLKEQAVWQNGSKYPVTVSALLKGSGQTLTKTILVTPKIKIPKITHSVSTPVFHTDVAESHNTQKLYISCSYGEIENIQLLEDPKRSSKFTASYDQDLKLLKISLDGSSVSKPAKVTLRFAVTYKGQPAKTPLYEMKIPVTIKGKSK